MKIVLWPDPRLKQVSEPVTDPLDPGLLREMFSLMKGAGGVGLSAIQVGIPKRFFITSVAGEDKVWVNPTWKTPPPPESFLAWSGWPTKPMLEGCLSTPGMFDTVHRYPFILAHTDPADLLPVEVPTPISCTGILAQAIQHESEHLDGKMFVDHLKAATRSRMMGEMMKLKRRGGR